MPIGFDSFNDFIENLFQRFFLFVRQVNKRAGGFAQKPQPRDDHDLVNARWDPFLVFGLLRFSGRQMADVAVDEAFLVLAVLDSHSQRFADHGGGLDVLVGRIDGDSEFERSGNLFSSGERDDDRSISKKTGRLQVEPSLRHGVSLPEKGGGYVPYKKSSAQGRAYPKTLKTAANPPRADLRGEGG